jgi:transcriptional regulator
MYLPSHFAVDNPEWTSAFVDSVGAADLVTFAGDRLVATLLPVLWEQPDGAEYGRLLGHIALANPQWRTADPGVPALAIVNGPHAYVSPSWYATKRTAPVGTARVVPTWNYVSVHFTGTLRFHREPAWLHDVVSRLTDRHERDRRPAWRIDEAPAAYVDGQLRGIVGVELLITDVEAKAKLSQNRAAADRAGVVEGLAGEPSERGVALARLMTTFDG